MIPRSAHGISRSNINPNALKVLYRLKESGFSAYLVGGGVRDLLVGLHPKDFDIVTNAHPEQIKPLFRSCILIGRRFRLAHVRFGRDIIEVATFRAAQDPIANTKHHHSKHGMLLRDNVYGTIEEDVWRRDFTVNALYYNIADFSIVDYCNGMKDLNNKTLRMIGDPAQRYHEDPVRLLRAVRLAAKLNFTLAPETEAPVIKLAPLLQHVPAARLFDEVLKLFHSGHALQTLQLLRHYHLFPQLFPQTARCLAKENNTNAEVLLTLTCQTTDDRINSGKHVSPAFLFASLLWHPVQTRTKELIAQRTLPALAQQNAAHEIVSAQLKIISVPRLFSTAAREIWALQFRLERCYAKQVTRLVEHPRFRAAYDFLVLRAASGERVTESAQWWTTYLATEEAERPALLEKLPRPSKPRRPRKKAKKNA